MKTPDQNSCGCIKYRKITALQGRVCIVAIVPWYSGVSLDVMSDLEIGIALDVETHNYLASFPSS